MKSIAFILFHIAFINPSDAPATATKALPPVGSEFAVAIEFKTEDAAETVLLEGDLVTLRSISDESIDFYSSDLDRIVKLQRNELDGNKLVPVKSAGEIYNRLLAAKPKGAWYRRRAVVQHAQLEWKSAITDWTAAIELDARDAKAWLGRALARRQLKQFEEAIADCSQAIEIKPDLVSVWQERALAYWSLQKWEQAQADFDKYVSLSPKSPAAYRSRGNFSMARQLYAKAVDDFGKAVELDQRDYLAIYQRGRANHFLRKYAEAVDDYTQAIAIQPTYAAVYLDRAVIFIQRKENELAIRDLDVALQLAPANAVAYQNRAIAYLNSGKTDAAIADYRKMSEVAPQNPVPQQQIVLLLGRGLRWQEQAEAIGWFIDHEPKVMAHRLNRAKAWRQAGKVDSAIQDLTFVVNQDGVPEREVALSERSRIHVAEKNVAAALDDLNALISGWPDRYEHRVARSELKMSRGQYLEAIADCDEAVARGMSADDPKVASALIQSAWIRATATDPNIRDGRKAILDATRACASTNWKDAHFISVLAAANAEAGRFEDAVSWQKLVLEQITPLLKSGDDSAREARQQQMTLMQSRLELYQANQALRLSPQP